MEHLRIIKTSAFSRPALALIALLAIGATFSMPLESRGTERAMLFPTDTAPTASILYASNGTYETAKWTTKIVVTSYNSVPEQTDSTPFITAFGTQVRDGIIASNYLPRGTRVRFPDMFGEKVFTVEDRMNARYYKRADIWSDDMVFSRVFGARYLTMEVL